MEYLARQSNLILDFSALDFISSAGLRVLLMAAKRIGKDNGCFLLCEVSQPVREVLEISGFLGMIEVVGSLIKPWRRCPHDRPKWPPLCLGAGKCPG